MIRIMLACCLALLAGAWILAEEPPRVRIESPPGGWTLARKITIGGTVSDLGLHTAFMTVNGTEFIMKEIKTYDK